MTAVSWESLYSDIQSRFKTLIEDVFGVYVQYGNKPYSLDESTDDLPGGVWLRMDILPGASEQVTICLGRRTWRTVGIVQVMVLGPLDEGEKACLVMADHIKNAFRSTSITGVIFQTPYLDRVGREGDSWRIDIKIPFYSDDLET